jgi:pimeloyl-ACP methyl ester carboxylesterase
MNSESIKVKSINLIVIIPGNPGIAAYYKPFEEKLDLLTKNQFKIHTLNYKGFENFPQGRQFNLNEELEDKIDQLEKIIKSYEEKNSSKIIPNIKIILIGHSIGSWIAHQMMDLRPNLPIRKIFYIFPFFHKNKKSKLQNFLGLLLKAPLLFKLILGLHFIFSSLPKILLNLLLISKLKHLNANGIFVTWKYFIQYKHVLKSVFYLAKSEFEILPNQLQKENYSKRIEDRHFFYNTKDMWAPLESLEILKQEYSNLNYSLYSGALHDFCVTDKGIAWVSQEISNIITPK